MAIRGGGLRKLSLFAALTVGAALWSALPAAAQIPAEPPLATSSNVHLLDAHPRHRCRDELQGPLRLRERLGAASPCSTSRKPASPQLVGALPLPHFENEDVDLCGNILIVVNDREAEDLGSVLYVVSIANPTTPTVIAVLPLGLTGSGRGSGHIANFVKTDCTQAWIDGGDHVEVVDLTDPDRARARSASSSRPLAERRLQGLARHRARQHRARSGTSAAAARPATS